MPTRTFSGTGSAPHAGVLWVEEGCGSHHGDRHRVLLAEILDREPRANLRLLGREKAHQDGLVHRWSRPRAGQIGAASVAIDDPLALSGQDRLAPHHEALEA